MHLVCSPSSRQNAGGSGVTIYGRSSEGHYASALGAPVDADDPALALPMMHQAALAGFVPLGPKPTGEGYRPDEIETMADLLAGITANG